jgi:aryl-alcohol dehydrogenase-like predicted oxidoreductase
VIADRIRIADGIEVARVGFGGLHLSGPGFWGPPADPAAARRLLHRALELGVEFIDTADTYGGSEETLADALYPYPPELVIASKGGLDREGPEIGGFTHWPHKARPEQLKRACEISLSRLRLDCLTLYQLHSPDPEVPLVESVGALKELQDEGKIRHIGVSNVSVDELAVARGLVEVVSVQNNYSVGDREHEELLAVCERDGLTFIPWYPLAGGEGSPADSTLARIARSRGASPSQVAIAWLLASSPRMLPIPGTKSLAHLEENVAAAGLSLDDDEMTLLDAAV